jgi:hypothetical protein
VRDDVRVSLSWPPGFPRTEYPAQSRFGTPEECVKRNLEFQLDLMDATSVVVTSNSELRRDGRPYANQRISDTEVAVYFMRKGREQAIACDKWDSIRDNLQAVAKPLELCEASTDGVLARWSTQRSRASLRSRHQRAPELQSGRGGHGMRCWVWRPTLPGG